MALSKRSTKEPTDDTQPVSRHSLTYLHSLPRRWGTHSGTKPSGAAPGSNRIRAWAVTDRMVGHQPFDFTPLWPRALALGLDDDRFPHEPCNRVGQVADADFLAGAEVDGLPHGRRRDRRPHEAVHRVGDKAQIPRRPQVAEAH